MGRYVVGAPYSRFAVVYYPDRGRLRRPRLSRGAIVWRFGFFL